MKILGKNLKKGIVKLVPETPDDLWHIYNIIHRDDEVHAYTTREIKPTGKYERPGRGERVAFFLGIKAETISWDRLLGRLRVHGTICQAPDNVPNGAHHTLAISTDKPVTIVKEEWKKHHLDRLEKARRTSEKPLTIISIDDENYVIATTTQYGLEEKVAERIKLPGKHETERRAAAVKEYFRKVLNDLRTTWNAGHNPIVVLGVGFVKNDFMRFLKNEDPEISKSVADLKSVNNSGIVGINEALRSGILVTATRRLRIAEETEIVEEILKRLGKEEATVAYGLDDVRNAILQGAVERLIIADSSLRDSSDEQRLLLEKVMSETEQKGGDVMVFSTEHEAGAKLSALGGVAALLRFPVLTQQNRNA